VLHLRLRVPGDLADQVVELLEDNKTVTNVAAVPAGFKKPEGWLVLADVARENATAVIKQLRQLDLQHRGSISIEEIDTILSDEADRVERAAPGAPDDGVVWVSVEQHLRDDSRLSFAFIAFIIALNLLHVPYAVLFTVIASLLEFIPIVGPLVTAILILGTVLVTGGNWIGVLVFLGVWRIVQVL